MQYFFFLVGRLIDFGLMALLTEYQSISGRLPERGEKENRNDRRKKNVKKKRKTTAPTASAVGPCPCRMRSDDLKQQKIIIKIMIIKRENMS